MQGIAYIASAGGRTFQGTLSLAGRTASVLPGNPWWATVDTEDWPEGLEAAIAPLWDVRHGDRQSELVIIGRHMDKALVSAALDGCVLREDELAVAPPDAWAQVSVKTVILTAHGVCTVVFALCVRLFRCCVCVAASGFVLCSLRQCSI